MTGKFMWVPGSKKPKPLRRNVEVEATCKEDLQVDPGTCAVDRAGFEAATSTGMTPLPPGAEAPNYPSVACVPEGDARSIMVKCVCVRQRTMELRWNICRRPSFGFALVDGFTPVLEQAYVCLACGEKSWRAIPTFPQPGVTR